MSSPYLGEIRMFAGNFAPAGWMLCQGQTLPISENDALFNLIGTTYGGDGQNTFNLPNLSSRVPVHMGTLSGGGQTFQIGEQGGTEDVTLTLNQIPNHSHVPQCNSQNGTATDPANAVWAANTDVGAYAGAIAASANMAPQAMAQAGGSQPHDNMIPFLGINFIISLFGIYPFQT
jgi:microcystin-dependent protein